MTGHLFTYDAPEDLAPPPRRRRRWWLVAAAVALVVLIVAAVLRFWPSPPDEAGTPGGDEVRPAPAAPALPGQSCGEWDSADLDMPSAAELATAPSVTWSLVGGMATPSSAETGPAFSSPVRWCYAHTWAGALVAVSNFYVQQQDRSVDRADLIEYAVADTPARDAALAELQSRGATAAPPNPARPTLRGFHVLSYTPDVASIDLAHEWRGSLVSGVYELRYEDGDWRVVMPPDFRFPLRIVGVELDTSYFVPWQAP